MGQNSSQSYQLNETNTIVDSYNKTFNSTSNMSDVGNVTIGLPSVSGGGGGSEGILLALVGVAVVVVFMILRKG